jgi:ring-1,2-phenylacetyl-CoA epoxidase subunit PaaD
VQITTQQVWQWLQQVPDPEVPVLSVLDLGVVRNVQVTDATVHVSITPTYTGCPAMDMISMNIKLALLQKGAKQVTVTQQLLPVWTTDWITDEAKQKLQAYGIAPPQGTADKEDTIIICPQCKSTNTQIISQFGSTACKALYKCNNCLEPFDYFKCH